LSKPTLSPADIVRSRVALVLLFALWAGNLIPATAQTPAPSADLKTLIGNLSSLDYPTRNSAARLIRRAAATDAVPALVDAVRRHPDEYVRNRAFIVLSSFNDKGTGDLVRALLTDRNDRLRESLFKWLEQHPDPKLAPTLLAALQTEIAEFVRPALIGALTAVDQDALVQRALVAEAGRGLDLFRSAVIDALGRHHAAYAFDAIAPITRNEGPLQQDAVLAIGRIGGPKADATLASLTGVPADVQVTVRAAMCLAGKDCATHVPALAAAAVGATARPGAIRASIAGLAAIAEAGNVAALQQLLELGMRAPALHEEVALGFSALALRRPSGLLDWLDSAPEPARNAAIELLKVGFELLEDDFAEEQFYAAARAMYWQASEGSPTRTLMASLIQRLEF
jgi:HEAT repeat protein